MQPNFSTSHFILIWSSSKFLVYLFLYNLVLSLQKPSSSRFNADAPCIWYGSCVPKDLGNPQLIQVCNSASYIRVEDHINNTKWFEEDKVISSVLYEATPQST